MNCAVEPIAEDALLLHFGQHLDSDTNRRVHQAAQALRRARLAMVTEIVPAYATLLIRFDPFTADSRDDTRAPYFQTAGTVQSVLDVLDVSPDSTGADVGSIIEVPVCYGGACGQDLAELAARAQLAPEAFVATHTACEYTVAMLGFAPGFPYLLGLDPKLYAPRRATPRTRVPAGSVAIGGAQTGIYPRELPGGWNLIGRTPLTLFDPRRAEPALLKPGDRVRFVAIDAAEFSALSRQTT